MWGAAAAKIGENRRNLYFLIKYMTLQYTGEVNKTHRAPPSDQATILANIFATSHVP